MIAETSGSCIVVFTGDSAFLYSVIRWTVNVTCVWVKMLYHCYKFCLSSNNLVASGFHVSGSQVSGSQVSGSRVSGSRVSSLKFPGPRSRVSGLGSRVSGPDFRLRP